MPSPGISIAYGKMTALNGAGSLVRPPTPKPSRSTSVTSSVSQPYTLPLGLRRSPSSNVSLDARTTADATPTMTKTVTAMTKALSGTRSLDDSAAEPNLLIAHTRPPAAPQAASSMNDGPIRCCDDTARNSVG